MMPAWRIGANIRNVLQYLARWESGKTSRHKIRLQGEPKITDAGTVHGFSREITIGLNDALVIDHADEFNFNSGDDEYTIETSYKLDSDASGVVLIGGNWSSNTGWKIEHDTTAQKIIVTLGSFSYTSFQPAPLDTSLRVSIRQTFAGEITEKLNLLIQNLEVPGQGAGIEAISVDPVLFTASTADFEIGSTNFKGSLGQFLMSRTLSLPIALEGIDRFNNILLIEPRADSIRQKDVARQLDSSKIVDRARPSYTINASDFYNYHNINNIGHTARYEVGRLGWEGDQIYNLVPDYGVTLQDVGQGLEEMLSLVNDNALNGSGRTSTTDLIFKHTFTGDFVVETRVDWSAYAGKLAGDAIIRPGDRGPFGVALFVDNKQIPVTYGCVACGTSADEFPPDRFLRCGITNSFAQFSPFTRTFSPEQAPTSGDSNTTLRITRVGGVLTGTIIRANGTTISGPLASGTFTGSIDVGIAADTDCHFSTAPLLTNIKAITATENGEEILIETDPTGTTPYLADSSGNEKDLISSIEPSYKALDGKRIEALNSRMNLQETLLKSSVVDTTIWQDAITQDSSGWSGFSGRTVIPASAINGTGDKISVTLRSGATGVDIAEAYVGNASATGDPYDFDGNQVQLLFSGSGTVSLGPKTSLASDFISAPTIDTSKDLIVSFNVSGNDTWDSRLGSSASTYYKITPTPEASLTDVTGYIIDSGRNTGVESIILRENNDPEDVVVDFSSYIAVVPNSLHDGYIWSQGTDNTSLDIGIGFKLNGKIFAEVNGIQYESTNTYTIGTNYIISTIFINGTSLKVYVNDVLWIDESGVTSSYAGNEFSLFQSVVNSGDLDADVYEVRFRGEADDDTTRNIIESELQLLLP